MDEFIIEDGIEMPRGWMGKRKYPLDTLEIGQSVFLPKGRGLVSSLVVYYNKKSGKQFKTRTSQKDMYDEAAKKFVPTTGIRIWRVA
jgi:hypothetical protein